MRRLFAAIAPTAAAYAWRNRDRIGKWWEDRNRDRAQNAKPATT